ncbi:NAD(P)/FAD-dependent oxidoreductase [Clostridium cellulovorans]|uniref:HI0933 family protein n=1 Tax=Clostridium cellulovorans (strain ATCC 35296 / DSM 3052 / OCM 3 / 743B) TaxID=573061 RepID=D9SN17_CLOC7|nr:NAD(P)/FAD-dependent oxidoreductase [Clostridium cellulovorans]ADL51883.1 HI0933 family protein [Clostridium cellulovorans 743B]
MANVIVIGGGPSGMMAAIEAAKQHKVTLIEKNEKLGKKLFITGKGRCNITNAKDIEDFFPNIPGNPYFLYSALYSLSNKDVMDYFENKGVPLKIERGERVFPVSDKSSDIIAVLEKNLNDSGVLVMLNRKVKDIGIAKGTIDNVILEDNSKLKADYYIFATGGMSYPQTGSNGEGHIFSQKLGHSITEIFPALVPITTKEDIVRELQGLSLKNVELKILDGKKAIYKSFGEMLFTHFGISGPIVLTASRLIHGRKNLKAVINLKPALSKDELDKRIQKDFLTYQNKDFKNSLDELLPKKLIDIIIRLCNIPPDKKVNSITKEERLNLVHLLQNFTLEISGTRPIAEAIITAGGINTKDIDPSTMKSKIVENLYFCGEIIDVDANTGGFNLQIALSTGFLAGKNIGK